MASREAQDSKPKSLTLFTGDGFWDAGAVQVPALSGNQQQRDWLFVGSLSAAESANGLHRHNIQHVLTVARNLPVRDLPCNTHHIQMDIDDHPNADLFSVLPECLEYIDQAYTKQEGILVHCASGMSRSVSIVVAWLLCRKIYSAFDQALEAVRVNRPLANPNLGFSRQLQLLEVCRGDLQEAISKWKDFNQTNLIEHTSRRRQLANDIHAAVDELEVC